jgi:uncharacterized protein (DUF305 family)
MSRAAGLMAVISCTLVISGCSSPPPEAAAEEAPVVQLGAPGESNRELTPQEVSELAVPSFTAADVAFVQMMIRHHEQALEMTALVPSRTERDDLPLLAERLEVAQRDETAQMERWLEERGELATSRYDHSEGSLMPGMLTPAEMSRLSAAQGAEFDELFLQFMIRHHEGAIVMVEELLTKGEGGQEPEIFQLAQHIDADQRVEISRMKRLLAELQGS